MGNGELLVEGRNISMKLVYLKLALRLKGVPTSKANTFFKC